MREVLPLIELLKEINGVIPLYLPQPKIHCNVFKDSTSCISVATTDRFSPQTKHIAIKYHHFRRYVKDKTIQILPIRSSEQTADIFTKPLDQSKIQYYFSHSKLIPINWNTK